VGKKETDKSPAFNFFVEELPFSYITVASRPMNSSRALIVSFLSIRSKRAKNALLNGSNPAVDCLSNGLYCCLMTGPHVK
jgi:hypothetical protein